MAKSSRSGSIDLRRAGSREVGAADVVAVGYGSSDASQVWFNLMSGKLRVTWGSSNPEGFTWTRRYERRETEVAIAAC